MEQTILLSNLQSTNRVNGESSIVNKISVNGQRSSVIGLPNLQICTFSHFRIFLSYKPVLLIFKQHIKRCQ